jgi:hypothetical protein
LSFDDNEKDKNLLKFAESFFSGDFIMQFKLYLTIIQIIFFVKLKRFIQSMIMHYFH